MIIKNRGALASVGDISARQMMLEIAEAVMQSLDSHRIIGEILRLEGDTLRIGQRKWELPGKRRLYVVGAGKAANAMARAVEEALGSRITQGLVIVKQLEPGDSLAHIELVAGGHPIPNEAGLSASRRMLDIVAQAAPDDLFIGLISGGSSALMSCPVPGISLDDEQKATEALLKSGARILEINAVRRHISATNGGRLAQKVEAQGAEMINFFISDSLGSRPTLDPLQPVKHWGTPCAPDATTLQDARDILTKYSLAGKLPRISRFLRQATEKDETPKEFGDRIHHFVVGRPADACEAAKQAAEQRGIAPCVLTSVLEGESSEAGTFLAAVAREVRLNNRPLPAPCLLIAGGETTTRVEGAGGEGGPSQELALGFALEIAGQRGICLCALDTDGTDGPTSIAGGLVDGTTVQRAREKGLDCYRCLCAHDSSTALRAAGDAVCTGNTGTNVCDLNMIYISGQGYDGRIEEARQWKITPSPK
jgi:glycerate-2-kinase